MSRAKNTKLLAIISALNLLVTSVFSLVIGRSVLVYLGSEYNGLNSIVAQFLTVLSVFEGGFTTASLVALMRPYQENDVALVNQIFAETRTKFNKLSCLILFIGVIASVVYAYAVKTSVPYIQVLLILLIGLVSLLFNLGVVSKYRLVFQVAQEEHIFALVSLLTTIFGQLAMLAVLILTKNIVLLRLTGMLATMLTAVIVIALFNKRYTIIDKSNWDGQKRIKGTKDVLIGKIVGTIHSSSTVFFLSIFNDATVTSVYAVYNSIIHLIVSVANIGFTAPQNGIGQVLQSDDEELKKKIVLEYEYIVVVLLSILFVPLSVLLIPFVKIYTSGINDVQYVNYLLAVLMVLSTYFQLIHIPAGICIYMAGEFKIGKLSQMIALGILIFANLVLGSIWGLYGFLVSILLCNAFLAVFEIGYLHFGIIKNTFASIISKILLNFMCTLSLILTGSVLTSFIHDYMSWFMVACIITVLSCDVIFIFNKCIFKKSFDEIILRAKSMLQLK